MRLIFNSKNCNWINYSLSISYFLLAFILCLPPHTISAQESEIFYEFNIYKDGKPFIANGKKRRVESFLIENGEIKQILQSECKGENKYCYRFSSDYLQNLHLKIIGGKDTMHISSVFSIDSLVFQPGHFHYANQYAEMQVIHPASPGITLIPVNPFWKEGSSKEYPDAFFSRINYIKKPEIRFVDKIAIDSARKLVVASQHEGLNDIFISNDLTDTWCRYKARSRNDIIDDLCLTKEKNLITISKENSEGISRETYLLEDYLDTTKIKENALQKVVKHGSVVCKGAELAFRQEEYEMKQQEEDSCTATIVIDGNPVFNFNFCNVKYYDTYSKKYKYLPFSEPDLYRYKNKIILAFKYSLIYSEDGRNWKYYSTDEFYNFLSWRFPIRLMNNAGVMNLYWLEGKGILGQFEYLGIVLIDVNHK